MRGAASCKSSMSLSVPVRTPQIDRYGRAGGIVWSGRWNTANTRRRDGGKSTCWRKTRQLRMEQPGACDRPYREPQDGGPSSCRCTDSGRPHGSPSRRARLCVRAPGAKPAPAFALVSPPLPRGDCKEAQRAKRSGEVYSFREGGWTNPSARSFDPNSPPRISRTSCADGAGTSHNGGDDSST